MKEPATSLYVLYIAIAYIMHSFIEWGVHLYMDNFEQLHIDHHDDEDEESGLYFSLTNPKVILMMYIPSLLLMALYKHLFSNVDFWGFRLEFEGLGASNLTPSWPQDDQNQSWETPLEPS